MKIVCKFRTEDKIDKQI